MKYMIVDMCDHNGIESYSIFDSREEAYICYWERANVISSNYTVLEIDACHIKYYDKDNKTINFMQLVEIDNL